MAASGDVTVRIKVKTELDPDAELSICVECAALAYPEKHQAWHHEQRRRAERVDGDLRQHTETSAQMIRQLRER